MKTFLCGKNRDVINQLTEGAGDKLDFMGCGEFDVGLYKTHIGGLSVAGELGYEINCRMGDHIGLRRLLEAGAMQISVNMALMPCSPCG